MRYRRPSAKRASLTRRASPIERSAARRGRRFLRAGRGDARGMIRIGCSGWSYEHWRGSVYPSGEPESRWLELYAQWFDTVEVNASFYRLPTRKAVARWASATPPGFCFAVKASR